jgi:hypothetical protein
MSRRRVLWLLAAALPLGACVDHDAGPMVLSGRAALMVGLDLSARGLPGTPTGIVTSGSLTGGADDHLALVIANLPTLQPDRGYQVWLVDESGGAAPRRIGTGYQAQRPDTVGTDEFTGRPIIEWRLVGEPQTVQRVEGRTGLRHVLTIRQSDAADAGTSLADFTHVVLTIGGAGDASPADSPTSAFYRYRNATTGAYLLGGTNRVRFGFRPELPNNPWTAFGGGTIEFLNIEGFGLRANRIARPPFGYFYEIWLYDAGTRDRAPRPPVNLGPATTPAPEFQTLVDADVTITDLVTQTQILSAAKWIRWPDLDALPDDFTDVLVVLRAKDGVTEELPPAVIFEALVPRGMARLPMEREHRIRGTH